MPRLPLLLLAAAALVVSAHASAVLALAPQTWEFRDGQWRQVTSPATRPATTQQDVRGPVLDRTDEAIEMLWRVQQRSPGSPLAEQALKRTADFFYRDGQFDLSAAVYGVYIERYPRSPLVPEVRLKQAYSNLAQMRGLRFDP